MPLSKRRLMDKLTALQQFFILRNDTFALQQTDGSYVRVNNALSSELLDKHLNGDITVGIYVVSKDGQSRIGVMDLDLSDEKTKAQMITIQNVAAHYLVPSFDDSYRDSVPVGIVAYESREVLELFGEGKTAPSPQSLCLIHEAKKHGGHVIGYETDGN